MLLQVEDGSIYELRDDCVQPGSLFDVMRTTSVGVARGHNGAYIIGDISANNIQLLCDILNHTNIVDDFCMGTLHIDHDSLEMLESMFDRFAIDIKPNDWNYIRAMVREQWMRDNMYKKEFADHPMNTDPYYNLHKVCMFDDDGNILEYDEINRQLRELFMVDLCSQYHDDDSLLFNSREPMEICRKLRKRIENMRKYTTVPGIFLAGGYIFAALFGTHTTDFDLFLTETYLPDGFIQPGSVPTTDDAIKKRIHKIADIYSSEHLDPKASNIHDCIYRFLNLYVDMLHGFPLFSRTENAITMSTAGCQNYNRNDKVLYGQVILRVYKTYSEVLHGFDVDSCCMGFDGKNLLFTERAVCALRSRVNRVNFSRMSPSYEYRLAKYAKRGIPIKVPRFIRPPTDELDKFVFYLRCSHKAWQDARGIGDELKNIGSQWYENIAWSHDDPPVVESHNPEALNNIYQARADAEKSIIQLHQLVDGYTNGRHQLPHICNLLTITIDKIIEDMAQAHSNVVKTMARNEDLRQVQPMEVFNKWKSAHDEKDDYEKPLYNAIDRQYRSIYRKLHRNVQGLNRLLVLERLGEKRTRSNYTDPIIFASLVQSHSDYNPSVPFAQMRGESFRGGQRIDMLCRYLLSEASAEKYPDLYEANREFVENMLNGMRLINPQSADENIITICQVSINNVLCHPNKEVLCYNSLIIDDVLEPVIPDIIELVDRIGGTWKVPTEMRFKRIQPGEQTTSTFHRTVVQDPLSWYNGPFYEFTE